ncbi:Pentatricopeptide repeat-containing protein At4g18975, chloroplastic [Linum perenne]
MNQVAVSPGYGFSSCGFSIMPSSNCVCSYHISTTPSCRIQVSCSNLRTSNAFVAKFSKGQGVADSKADKSRRITKKVKDSGQHLWKKRDSAGSGKKALNLVRIISEIPNEKEAVYGALDKWTAWETEFPVIAAAKALQILRKKAQWQRVIQVAKWMLSKGQGDTMATYDTLLLAFDMDGRVDEAEALWSMVLHIHNRSISKRLFARMIFLYDHHDIPNGIVEVPNAASIISIFLVMIRYWCEDENIHYTLIEL